eukprot:1138432-Pelagomonas_calceolata.AAC.2
MLPVRAYHWVCHVGFVLVGRALEERAKLQASADMVALQVSSRLAWQSIAYTVIVNNIFVGQEAVFLGERSVKLRREVGALTWWPCRSAAKFRREVGALTYCFHGLVAAVNAIILL